MSDDDDRRPVSAATVLRLIEAQFPNWADLPVQPVDNDGWDNHSFMYGYPRVRKRFFERRLEV